MTTDPQLELKLMTEIRDEWGSIIAWVCRNSSVSPAFLAALIAEESGGKPDEKRFEPGVLHALWEVLLGREEAYGSIGRGDLLLYVLPKSVPAISNDLAAVITLFSAAFHRVDNLATSWGLTQVMGYHVLEGSFGLQSTDDLILPSRQLPVTLRLLAQFAIHFKLNLAADYGALFTCWNTGRPDGKTADPEYASRGLARMQIYAQLPPAPEATS